MATTLVVAAPELRHWPLRTGQKFDKVDPSLINNYIGGSFSEMQQMGEEVYRPFLQDVMQAGSLSRIIWRQILKSPGTVSSRKGVLLTYKPFADQLSSECLALVTGVHRFAQG